MINEEFAIGCTEALVVLSKLPKQDKEKLDLKAIETLKQNANLNYKVELIPGRNINDQRISETGRALLSLIYRNTFASPEEKLNIRQKDMEEIERMMRSGEENQ